MLIDGLSIGAIYALLALGLSLVFSVMGLVNFAYGSLIVWSGYAIALFSKWGIPYAAVIPLMIGFVVILSIGMARVAFRPFLNAPPATLLLTSFGLALASQAVVIAMFGEGPVTVPTLEIFVQTFSVLDVTISYLQLIALSIAVIVVLGLQGLLRYTRFGMEVRALAEDSNASQLMGVRTHRIIFVIFALSGSIAAVVAVIWFARLGTVDPRADLAPTLKAFIAVVLGGIGTIRGAIIGGILFGLLESLVSAILPSSLISFQQSLAFGLVIFVLLLIPGGISGRLRLLRS